MLRSVCPHYQKKGMFSSKCKTCGQPKEGCGAWLNEKKPGTLVDLCSSSTPPTARVDELIAAGINLRYQARVKRDLIVATLNTCEGVWARAGGAQVAAGAGGGAGRRERVERRFDQAIAERFT